MATNPLFSPNFPHIFSPNKHLPSSYPSNQLSFTSLQSTTTTTTKRKLLTLTPPSVASFQYPQSSPPPPPISVNYLEQEFSGHGVTFEDVGGGCVAKMSLENGSLATLMLPSGLITSYKAPMWHGGTMELLHTIVSQGDDDDGDPVIQGGVSLAFGCHRSGGEFEWFPVNWSLFDIKGNPHDSIQVELISRDKTDMVEMRYIVRLKEDVLSSEITISNNDKSSMIELSGAILSHLTISTPEATYAVGMEGSDFINRSPPLSNYAIIPPENETVNKFGIGQLWNPTRGSKENGIEEMEGEEKDNYKQLTEKMRRIYTSAPTHLTLIDRGRRNSVVAGRHGFNELYLFSPGSRHEFYSKYAYICIGPSAALKPIVLQPGSTWRGGQELHNPNL